MDVTHGSLDHRPVEQGWWRASDGRWYLRELGMVQTSPVGVRSKMRWLQLAVLVLGMGGAYLMLYGNAQNNTGGSGGLATITGTAVVIVVGVLVVVTSLTGEGRSRRQHTSW